MEVVGVDSQQLRQTPGFVGYRLHRIVDAQIVAFPDQRHRVRLDRVQSRLLTDYSRSAAGPSDPSSSSSLRSPRKAPMSM